MRGKGRNIFLRKVYTLLSNDPENCCFSRSLKVNGANLGCGVGCTFSMLLTTKGGRYLAWGASLSKSTVFARFGQLQSESCCSSILNFTGTVE